jgi:hypothetical protein
MLIPWLIALSTCLASNTPAEGGESPRIVALKTPPDVHEPQAAIDAKGRVFVVYATPKLVSMSVSNDSGASFGDPIAVGAIGKISVGMRRGPRVAATPNAVVVSAIGGAVGDGHDGDLVAWRSTTSGVSWLSAVRVSTYPGSAREGLHAMTAGPKGQVACAWLDVRSGKMEIYAAVSNDEGASFGENRLVYHSPDGSVCQCCHPSIAFDAQGMLYVMFRNELDGARDMYITESKDGAKTFSKARKLGTGTWKIAACPMDGGALSIDADGRVTSMWRREHTVYKSDALAANASEEKLGDGEQPSIGSGTGGSYCAWLTHRGGELLLLAPKHDSPITLATDANDPMIASSFGGHDPVIIVWESTTDGKSAIRAARLDR